MDGEVNLAELTEDYGIDLQRDDIVTVAGLVLAQCGTVPEQGITVACAGYLFTVAETKGFKITRVLLTASKP